MRDNLCETFGSYLFCTNEIEKWLMEKDFLKGNFIHQNQTQFERFLGPILQQNTIYKTSLQKLI